MPMMLLSRENTTFVSNRMAAHLPFISKVTINLDAGDSERRATIEAYMQQKFSQRCTVNSKHFLPYLLSVRRNKEIYGTVGLRPAETGPLYLENYLSNPIEQEIGIYLKTAVQRENIIETGNLISTWRCGSQLLFIFLTDLLFRINRDWIVFTATREFMVLLKKMNLKFIPLAETATENPANGKDTRDCYNRDRPWVIFAHVPSAMSVINQNYLMSSSLSLFSNQLVGIATQWKL